MLKKKIDNLLGDLVTLLFWFFVAFLPRMG